MEDKQTQIAELEKESSVASFWQDTQRAQGIMRNLASLKDEVDEWTSLHERAMTSQELVSLAIEERDDSFLDSIAGEAHELSLIHI